MVGLITSLLLSAKGLLTSISKRSRVSKRDPDLRIIFVAPASDHKAFKSGLLMAVSAALSQGKWTWFRNRSGPLSTFKAIDAGSRDTLESFRLLWCMRGRNVLQL
ncbi:hypothetical protein E4T38_03051 [Aureobasidium subglaciale]|nr:hypothetical protein E4T38_03051 [Aureobasidium subglaciale]KAI5226856.1 hypothetical protein E4T40_02825 [Aureobasidium subglaciale]KAI5230129.1 hypothetical protein E4T41_03048 [Aureobasidium subglaciale]KAI5264663.1 hypothetical protein E4T46_02826 [Aureobasidium subglaciale]